MKKDRIKLADLTEDEIQELPNRFLCVVFDYRFGYLNYMFQTVRKRDVLNDPDRCFFDSIGYRHDYVSSYDVCIATYEDVETWKRTKILAIESAAKKYKNDVL